MLHVGTSIPHLMQEGAARVQLCRMLLQESVTGVVASGVVCS